MEGKVILGLDYYTQIIEENADMKAKIKALQTLINDETTSVLYVKDVATIFGIKKGE